MKTILASFVVLFAAHVIAADDQLADDQLAAVKAADKLRVEAVLSGDRDKLNAILSDELHYAHSSGVVDTKQSFIDATRAGS